MPLVGDGSARVQPVFVGRCRPAVAAVLAAARHGQDACSSWAARGSTAIARSPQLVLLEIDRQKPIIGVPAGLMKLAGFFAQQIARFGLVPPITADQVELMMHDNIVRPGAHTLATLGIEPTAAEAILPTYLDRFRIGGRYNQHAPA